VGQDGKGFIGDLGEASKKFRKIRNYRLLKLRSFQTGTIVGAESLWLCHTSQQYAAP